MQIRIEDPQTEDIVLLLQTHLDFCRSISPAENVFALDVASLRHPRITFFAIREVDQLVGVCALKLLDDGHGELKSMHVSTQSRGKGAAASLVHHVLAFAKSGDIHKVSLETSPAPEFAPARHLYTKCGFTPCGPFGDYAETPDSVFMTITL